MTGFTLRHLTFTGPGVAPAGITFSDGLNLFFGASNTGKSFAIRTLDFMFGGSKPLPGIEQRVGYDAVWLGLLTPDGTEITLYRSASGGAFRVFDGLLTILPSGTAGQLLQPSHDPSRVDTLSYHLLSMLGLENRVVVKNASGEKESFTIRALTPYMFVSEETIISERSPVLVSGQVILQTAEKNVFKTLLTGHDDAAVVTTVNAKAHKLSRAAKLEVFDELIAGLDETLGEHPTSREDLEDQAVRIEASLVGLKSNLGTFQAQIDELVSRRRTLVDNIDLTGARLTELQVTLGRFERLSDVYRSDVGRLQALEEGSTVLLALAGRPCAVCGAPPEAQLHTHGVDEVQRSHQAAAAEVRKIERERQDLQLTAASLSSEAEGLRKRLEELTQNVQKMEAKLDELRPSELQARKTYDVAVLKRDEVLRTIALYVQRDELLIKRAQYDVKRKGGKKADKLSVGIDGTTAFSFAQAVQDVLTAWHFPGSENVQFDLSIQDLLVAGKERGANGKGVRALLHAAFKVAALTYCRSKGLPHPGVVVLDTPLLTYREPLFYSRYGDLEPEEIVIRATGLAEHFYAHLASLKSIGQFIILENSNPPASVHDIAKIEVFTGRDDGGRFGFFPQL
jgi:peptidoglycan hydrolase CwlO-like protein